MIFVDTSAFFAWLVPNDPKHEAAATWMDQNTEPLITTDYIVDELLTLLVARGEAERALGIGEDIFAARICTLYWTTPSIVGLAWKVFQDYTDKRWSFTDCVSRVVMERQGIEQAIAFDDHFQQFGTVTVVP